MAKAWKPEEVFRCESVFERGKADDDQRAIELSFSSEMPVSRFDFDEILSHNPEDVDLSRLNNAHPLLLNHNQDQQIGVVESARIDSDRKGRAVVRFSRSQLGEEIWRDVKDGIRRLVSVGYRRTREVAAVKEGEKEVVRFAWAPYEISLVSVPADASVGVGREQPKEAEKKIEVVMSEETKTTSPDAGAIERNRVKEIIASAELMNGKIDGVRELANAAISSGMSLDDFRAQMLSKVATPIATKPAEIGMKPKEVERYSLTRAIMCAADNRGLSGIEREVSDECAKRFGPSKGQFWVPYDVMATRALQGLGLGTASLGGNLKETTLLAESFIEILRNRMVISRLGARTLTGLVGDIAIPRQYASTVAYWRTEVEAATASTLAINQLSLAPKGLTAKVFYSKQLLIQGTPSVDMLIRDDVTQQIALAIDLAALHGSGAAGDPTGVYAGAAAANLVTLDTNGASFLTIGNTACDSLISLETLVAVSNADVGNLAYITNPKVRGQLKRVPLNTNADTFMWTNGTNGEGFVNGYQCVISNQVHSDRTVGSGTTCSSVFFGNWADIILAFWGAGLDIMVDPYTQAGTREIIVYGTQYTDVGIRHTGSFSVLKGVNAG